MFLLTFNVSAEAAADAREREKKLKFPAKIGCRYSVYNTVAYLGFWRCGGLSIVRDQDKNLADFKLNSGSGKY